MMVTPYGIGRFGVGLPTRYDRPDDRDEIRSLDIPHNVTHDGALFEHRTWDIRYSAGEDRVTDAFYDEAVR